jgi:hypothetical protein
VIPCFRTFRIITRRIGTAEAAAPTTTPIIAMVPPTRTARIDCSRVPAPATSIMTVFDAYENIQRGYATLDAEDRQAADEWLQEVWQTPALQVIAGDCSF